MSRVATSFVILASAISLAGCGGGMSKPSAADRKAAATKVRHIDEELLDTTDECVITAAIHALKVHRRTCQKLPGLTRDLISELRTDRDVLPAAKIKGAINDALGYQSSEIGRACPECRKALSDARDELTSGG